MSDDRGICDPDGTKRSKMCYVCLAPKKLKDLGLGLGAEVEGEQIPRTMFHGSQGHTEIPRCKDCVGATILLLETFSGFQMICFGKTPEKKLDKLRQDLLKVDRQVAKTRERWAKNKGSIATDWAADHEMEALEALLAAAKNDEAAAREAAETSPGYEDKGKKLQKKNSAPAAAGKS